VRTQISVSASSRSAMVALIFASMTSAGTTFFPAMCPQRFGHAWSSRKTALAPMRS
jgi:hypothetical protein